MINTQFIYSINTSVDVYKIGNDVLEFYFINTRRRVTINVTLSVIELVSELNGQATIEAICRSQSIEISNEVISFLNYLLSENILYCLNTLEKDKNVLEDLDLVRYNRQLSYFDSAYQMSPYQIQKKLQDEVVVIFGIGSIGSGIALQLVMSGIRKLILIDKDVVSKDSLERHFMFKQSDIGRPKTEAFSEYLKILDSKVECESYHEVVDFNTSLEKWIEGASLVVNTLDEPYIGITSLKVGRACYHKNIPLYIAGGFDAHLMSTGELVVPGQTPCVDCYTTYFSDTLKDWKPKYNLEAISEEQKNNNTFEVGGLASMSLFSISYGVMAILKYLASNEAEYSRGRGELLFDQLEINYLNIPKNPKCIICGSK